MADFLRLGKLAKIQKIVTMPLHAGDVSEATGAELTCLTLEGAREMGYDPRAVANYFLKKADASGAQLTPMQIIKLVYIAHGWHLALLSAPLVRERVEAWDFGPVIRSLYQTFKRFGRDPITQPVYGSEGAWEAFGWPDTLPEPISADFNKDELALLDAVWENYGHLSGIQLSKLTHQPDTPWARVYEPGRRNLTIPDDAIATYYKKLAKKNAETREQQGGTE